VLGSLLRQPSPAESDGASRNARLEFHRQPRMAAERPTLRHRTRQEFGQRRTSCAASARVQKDTPPALQHYRRRRRRDESAALTVVPRAACCHAKRADDSTIVVTPPECISSTRGCHTRSLRRVGRGEAIRICHSWRRQHRCTRPIHAQCGRPKMTRCATANSNRPPRAVRPDHTFRGSILRGASCCDPSTVHRTHALLPPDTRPVHTAEIQYDEDTSPFPQR
jgi:hypothetical protein